MSFLLRFTDMSNRIHAITINLDLKERPAQPNLPCLRNGLFRRGMTAHVILLVGLVLDPTHAQRRARGRIDLKVDFMDIAKLPELRLDLVRGDERGESPYDDLGRWWWTDRSRIKLKRSTFRNSRVADFCLPDNVVYAMMIYIFCVLLMSGRHNLIQVFSDQRCV
jgi:hypothetical protein